MKIFFFRTNGGFFFSVQELRYVGGELGVVLEEEPVGRVRVDLQPGLRDQAGEQVGVARQDHRVAVAVGDEHRHLDGAQPLERRVVRDAPGAHRVVLRFAGRPAGYLVAVLGPRSSVLGPRSSVRAYMRPSASFPACWLASEAAKNTPRYSSGLVCGVPIAPITAGGPPGLAARAPPPARARDPAAA